MFKPKVVMFLTLVIMLMRLSCSGPESDQPLLTAELPLHLEDHLDVARIRALMSLRMQATCVHQCVRALSTPWRANPLWFIEHLWLEDEE